MLNNNHSEVKEATVVLLVDKEGRVCLARKKQPIHHEGGEISYSLGMYNGYGGKKEEGDVSIEDTAIRELFDESSVRGEKEDLYFVGKVKFIISKDGVENPFMNVSFYTLSKWEGDPKEGREMGKPEFFEKTRLPYHEMMPADKILFERIFEGRTISSEVTLFGKEKEPLVIFKDDNKC